MCGREWVRADSFLVTDERERLKVATIHTPRDGGRRFRHE
jgi:hypothetical protein